MATAARYSPSNVRTVAINPRSLFQIFNTSLHKSWKTINTLPRQAQDTHEEDGYKVRVCAVNLVCVGTASSWHLISRPLQWACHNVSCDCTFEQWGTLQDGALNLTSTLHTERADTAVYPAHSQELPGAETGFFFGAIFTLKIINLPRQAWDKLRES